MTTLRLRDSLLAIRYRYWLPLLEARQSRHARQSCPVLAHHSHHTDGPLHGALERTGRDGAAHGPSAVTLSHGQCDRAEEPTRNVSLPCRLGSAAENKSEVKAAGIPTTGHTVDRLELKTPACHFCYQDWIYKAD